MKPTNWNAAPYWAEYLAQDGSGGWWWYSEEPNWNEGADEGGGEWQVPWGTCLSASIKASDTLEIRL